MFGEIEGKIHWVENNEEKISNEGDNGGDTPVKSQDLNPGLIPQQGARQLCFYTTNSYTYFIYLLSQQRWEL